MLACIQIYVLKYKVVNLLQSLPIKFKNNALNSIDQQTYHKSINKIICMKIVWAITPFSFNKPVIDFK